MDNLQVDKVFVRLLDQNQKTTTKPGSDPKPYDRIYYVPPDSYKPFSVQLEAGVQTNRFGLTPKDVSELLHKLYIQSYIIISINTVL